MAVTLWPRARQVARSRCLGEANDAFNAMEVVSSCRLTTSLACAAQRRVVGSLDTIVARLPRVVEPPRTVAIHCEWAAGLHYTVAVLQSPCSHVLLAFITLPAARLAGARRRPCRMALWKIRARPDGRSSWSCRQGIFVYFNSPQPVELHGIRDGSGATLSQEAGAGATGHMAAPVLP
jgi:hypothetical protein